MKMRFSFKILLVRLWYRLYHINGVMTPMIEKSTKIPKSALDTKRGKRMPVKFELINRKKNRFQGISALILNMSKSYKLYDNKLLLYSI